MRAVLNTDFGPIEIREDNYYGNLVLTSDLNANAFVKLTGPTRREPDADVSLDVRSGFGGFSLEESDLVAGVIEFASNLGHLLEAATEGEREEARRREEEEERQAEEARKERERVIEERKERLMVEFLGDTVRIRERGYKILHRAVVEVRPKTVWNSETYGYDETDEFELRFNYVKKGTVQDVARMQRLDVQIGTSGRFETIWDDGLDDLSPWDRDNIVKARQFDASREE